MRCPACQSGYLQHMRTREQGVDLDQCPRCKGLWFDGEELEQVLPTAARELRVPSDATETDRPCPHCRTPLHAFNYPQTLVRVDVCPHCHGLWLDPREFKEIKLVREQLDKQGELETHAPVTGIKGGIIRFIDQSIANLSGFE
ncbi:MAG: zf-TFIIB domain-containing protein [Phycisphaeraceae bacterium]